MSDHTIFDRRQVRMQRDRAAGALTEHDFLFRESADRLFERLLDVTRKFPLALDLGCHGGEMAERLAGNFGIETLIAADLSPSMARKAQADLRVAADEEALPFAEGRFDLVVSNLSLHWVNDLPGALLQIRRLLKPDGLFLASMLGGETLRELRQCLLEAEIAEEGGAGPRVSPFVEVKDAGALLQRAGFKLPVADVDDVAVTYGDPFRLLADLRGMGETNALKSRRRGFSRRATLGRAMGLYVERHGDAEGRIPATFQIVTLTGWSPDA
jgi:NADH dehydrogenase [ubiquinone] 1 alpha subcomplex assembly factor 5